MKGNEFLLGIFGLSRVERMTVTSVCSLTQRRSRGYSVLPVEKSADADIVLVDADDAVARENWRESRLFKQGRPALMIARDATQLSNEPYALPRTNFASRLVKILDQITIREFHFLPDGVVSDQAVMDPSLSTQPIRAVTPAQGRPRVLIVDDALVVRTQMQSLLQLHHVDAILAADAEQALALMEMQTFSLIFLDVVLPGMDGYTACRRMKSIDRNVPIVMLTGKDGTFDKIRGVMAGCSRYLTKPIAVEALSKVVAEYLEKQPMLPHMQRS